MKLFEYEYNGENYVFETTNKARAELKDLQMKGVKDFSAGDYLELMTDIKNLEIEGAKIDVMPESEEKAGLASLLEQKLTEVADKTQAMSIVLDNAELTTLDTMYVILKNTRKFKGNLSRELFDDIIYDMEEKMGDLKVFEMLEEAKQKAFSVFEEMTKAEAKFKKKETSPSKKNSKKSKMN